MNFARLYLHGHESNFERPTEKDLLKNFDDDIYYTQDRNYTHPLYGRVQLFREVNTNRMIMAIAETLDNEEETFKAITECRVRMRLNQPNLLFMLDYSIKKIQGFCSASYTLNRFFEFPMTNLTRDIRERQTKDEFFNYKELSLLCAQMLNVLGSLHANNVFHGNVSTNTIQHKRVNNFFVLLDSLEGNEDLIAFHQHCPSDTNDTYPSPELHQEVYEGRNRGIDAFKNDVFSLGMVVLAAGILRPVRDCYEPGGMFNPDPLQTNLNKFYLRYGGKQSPLCCAVTSMLDLNAKRRPDAKTVKAQFLNASLGESNIENAIQNMSDISEISPIDGDNQPTLPNAKILDAKVLNDTVEEPQNDTVLRGPSNAVAIKKVMAARVLQPLDFKSTNKGEFNAESVEKLQTQKLPVQEPVGQVMSPQQLQTRHSSTDKALTQVSPLAPPKSEKVEQRNVSVSKAPELKYDNFFEHAVPNVYKAAQPVNVQPEETLQIRRKSDIQPFAPKMSHQLVSQTASVNLQLPRPPSIILQAQENPYAQVSQQPSNQTYFVQQGSHSAREILAPKAQSFNQSAESMRVIRIDAFAQQPKPNLTRNTNSFIIGNQQTALEQPQSVIRSRSMAAELPRVIEPQSLRSIAQMTPNMPAVEAKTNSIYSKDDRLQVPVPISERQVNFAQTAPVSAPIVHSYSANINPRQNVLKVYNPVPNDVTVYSVERPVFSLSKTAAEAYENRVFERKEEPRLSVPPAKETTGTPKQVRAETAQQPKYLVMPHYNIRPAQRSVPDISVRQKHKSEFINAGNVYEDPIQLFKRKQIANQQTAEKGPNLNKTQQVQWSRFPATETQKATYNAPKVIANRTETVNLQQMIETKVPASSWQNVDLQSVKQQPKFIKTETKNRITGEISRPPTSQPATANPLPFSHRQVFRMLPKHTQLAQKGEPTPAQLTNYTSAPGSATNNAYLSPQIAVSGSKREQTDSKELPKVPKTPHNQIPKPSVQSFIQDRGHRQFYVSSNAFSSRKQSSYQ